MIAPFRGFQWTRKRQDAALRLAEGLSYQDAANQTGIAKRTICYWMGKPEFAAEVDRLSQLVSIASKAERMRLCNRIVRERVKADRIETNRDLLDWLKFAQSETAGIKLNLADRERVLLNDFGSPEAHQAPR